MITIQIWQDADQWVAKCPEANQEARMELPEYAVDALMKVLANDGFAFDPTPPPKAKNG